MLKNDDTEKNNKQQTVVQQVMEKIKAFVASGELKPGDRLPTELELAKNFGVSRSSIREAIKIFSYLGVLESQTRRGTILRGHSSISNEALTWTFLLGDKDYNDLIDLRKAIEQEAWMMLGEIRAKKKESVAEMVELLNGEVQKMKKAVAEKDIDALEQADYHFHRIVIEATRNEQYIKLFQTLKSFTLEEIRKSNVYRKLTRQIYVEHLQILKAFESGETAKVVSLFREHIKKTKKNVKAVVNLTQKP